LMPSHDSAEEFENNPHVSPSLADSGSNTASIERGSAATPAAQGVDPDALRLALLPVLQARSPSPSSSDSFEPTRPRGRIVSNAHPNINGLCYEIGISSRLHGCCLTPSTDEENDGGPDSDAESLPRTRPMAIPRPRRFGPRAEIGFCASPNVPAPPYSSPVDPRVVSICSERGDLFYLG
jgi:hypothetical protein